MKIIADENIPLVEHYFGSSGELVLKPGREINRQDLLAADILLVRSVTKVTPALLHGSSVRFVASSTAGSDHLDTQWMDQQGILWSVAKGCNAVAVVEYVIAVLAVLQKQNILKQNKMRAGVIGVGEIGAAVVKKLQFLGFDVVQHDPLRALQEQNFVSTPLEEFEELDFISVHTPLTFDGKYPTHHLLEKQFLARQKKGCVLLNSGRGSVINFADLKQYGKHLIWCLDVWEHEPVIDLDVLKAAFIATPHIAGYSIQSKYRGVEMIYQAAWNQGVISNKSIASVKYPGRMLSFENRSVDWRDVVLGIYNPAQTSEHMKDVLSQGKDMFDNLRKNFTERYEFGFVEIKDVVLDEYNRLVMKELGLLF